MKIAVPSSVDVNNLVGGLNLSKTKTKSLIVKTQYFLSLVTPNNFNYKEFEKNKGYKYLSSKIMKKILGKDYYLILGILKNINNPIVDCNEKYFYNMNNGQCKGYRLNKTYCTGELYYRTLDPKFENKIIRVFNKNKEYNELNIKYEFLFKQFKEHEIRFDNQVYEYIRKFGTELLSLVENENQFQKKMIYNKIGQWLYYIENIINKDIWSKVSNSNHRFNSNITCLPKVLRPFLLCNNKPMSMIDIKSSQPYLLGSIMNNKFFLDTTNGYNLKTIYKDLYNELNKNVNVINHEIPKIGYNNNISGRTIFNYNSSSTGRTGTLSPIMWSTFFNETNLNSFQEYIKAPYKDDFYNYTLKLSYPNISIEEIDQYREEMKSNMMYFLFDDKKQHRKHNKYIQLLSNVYPSVDEWIRNVHSTIGKEKFAYMLQRSESYLVLNEICREFNSLNPTVPLFTIHDAILTYDEYIPDLTRLILKRCKEITGIDVGYKVFVPKIDCKPSLVDIERIWEKIKNIKTEVKFAQLEGVFERNIFKGQNFLK